ncbi:MULTISPECIES: DUF1080 domain-containing protein [unclassified Dysgonomonas]|jgi:hypothetical protein|uniref:3-keto-disaccharide hydrolase n=1 Tax=unclassified Dysgonomonas TaxID=2630389 RepID=UPI0025C4AAFE|nr:MULTISPECIES: DUF1080 domain-containing protein [unclassified Dysgonomonas]MDR2004816.1 DUF1080 domain-containing protein [Prevotella sp.]HMM01433.1 DUF1080 domain-containing protein [Dysgonomonas sp.]
MNKIFNVAVLILLFLTSFSGQAKAQEVEKLFNGTDLSNWNFVLDKNNVPAEKVFYVEDGLIHIAGEPLGYMYTKQKYGNYHLHAEWRWPQGIESNSGIFLLIERPETPFPNGIECQLKAGSAGDFVLLNGSDLAEYKNPESGRPKFPVIAKTKASTEKVAGEWNCADVYCHYGVISVYINGVFQNKGTNKIKEGYIGLQSEGKDVEFRNVTLTPLP